MKLPESCQRLFLEGNKISDIFFIENYLMIFKMLNLSWNEVSDVSDLKLPKELYTLELRENDISDVSGLKLPENT